MYSCTFNEKIYFVIIIFHCTLINASGAIKSVTSAITSSVVTCFIMKMCQKSHVPSMHTGKSGRLYFMAIL